MSDLDRDEIDYLSVDDLLDIAVSIVPALEVRDVGLLAAAAARPRTSAFGAPAYATFPEQVAALLHSLARNHALVDGNKRLAWAASRVFCLLNDRDLELSVDEAERLVVGAATGELDVPALAGVIRRALRPRD